MSEITIDAKLDCTGLLCPMPVVKTKKALKPLEIGQTLEMISTDAGATPDMQAWSRQTGHDLLSAEELDGGVYRFVIRKTH